MILIFKKFIKIMSRSQIQMKILNMYKKNKKKMKFTNVLFAIKIQTLL